jgi:hypothetical protein
MSEERIDWHTAFTQAQYITDIKQIILSARTKAYNAVNSAMVEAYWLIGKRIVDEEQQGKHRSSGGVTKNER